MKNISIKFLALFLLLAFVFCNLTACGEIDFGLELGESNSVNNGNAVQGDDTRNNDNGAPSGNFGFPTNGDVEDIVFLSASGWYDYEEDTADFVYGIVANELEVYYDVFPAAITLTTGEDVYGLGFTDYSEAFSFADGSKTFFSSGFVSFVDEPEIPRSAINEGVVMDRLDDDEDEYGFVYTFSREPFSAHCVVFDEYVTYGVNDASEIFFTEQMYDKEYLRKNFDASLGTLYSYDEERVLNDLSFGKYVALGGVSLSEEIDFAALEAEINRIVAEQNVNFATVDIQTSVYIAQEALNSYLLSLQEETFMGYRVSDLVEISKQLDPMDCLRITADGFEVVGIEPTPPPTPSGLMKWMTGIVAGIAVIGGVVLSVYGLPHLGGAIIGAAVEVFTEVVVENKTLGNVDWRKIMIASVAGAISANLSLFGDSVVGGATNAAFTLIDGGTLEDAASSFAIGTAAGLALGGAFKLAGKGVQKLAKKLPSPPKVVKVSTVDDALNLDGKIAKKIDDPVVDATKYQAKKQAKNFIDIQLFANKADDVSAIPKCGIDALDSISDKVECIDHVMSPRKAKNSSKALFETWSGGHANEAFKNIKWDPEFTVCHELPNGVKILSPKDPIKGHTLIYDGARKELMSNHSFFPESWSKSKIAKAINYTAEFGKKVDGRNYAYRCIIDGVEVEVIKTPTKKCTGYPVG